MDWLTKVRWSPYAVGIGIGILSWLTFLISKKAIGCSTAFARTSGMIQKFFPGKKMEKNLYYQEVKPVVDWEWMLVLGIVIGSFLSSLLSGDFHWRWVPSRWVTVFSAEPLTRFIAALFGGICLGFGARWTGGCTSGHGISGTLQLTISSWISTACFFIGGILTALLLYNLIGH
jgi:uncharacterized membrane protein YedE/YeeE